jgi:sulfate adenylyltransferase
MRTLRLSRRQTADFELLANGGYWPLDGFQGTADWEAVLETMHLADGRPWPIPITLGSEFGEVGEHLRLVGHEGTALGMLTVEEAFERDLLREAQAVFRTVDRAHPGVAALLTETPRTLAGPIAVRALPCHAEPVARHVLTPSAARRIFAARGWKSVVGFQTRNPIHRAHEYLTKAALEMVDGLFIHPIAGETKADDLPLETRLRCYEALIERYFPPERVLLALNPASMRYAGPREAVFHALVRRNYGCTHFVVGRDHAGVGSFYGPYDAHRVFEAFADGELGIQPLFFEQAFYCSLTGGMATAKTSPAGPEARVTLSGTAVRELLLRGERPPEAFTRPEVADILIEAMARRDGQPALSRDDGVGPWQRAGER